MTNQASGADTEADSGRRRCCEPGLLQEIRCQQAGDKALADYNAKHADELADAQTAYAAARGRYTKARNDQTHAVNQARADVEVLYEDVRCHLDRDDLECLERAFAHVAERLERCGVHSGCCCDEACEDDFDVDDCDADDIPGRIEVLTRRTAEVTRCFHRLIAEPGDAAPPPPPPTPPTAPAPATAASPATPATKTPSTAPGATVTAAPPATGGAQPGGTDDEDLGDPLPVRVKKLQDEIAGIKSDAGKAGADWTTLYARLLVVRYRLDTIWLGFRNVNEYMECLCRATTCMALGHTAIAKLWRREAVHQCYRAAWKDACRRLNADPGAEVVAEYLRICSDDECEDEEGRDDRHGDDRHGGDRHRDDRRGGTDRDDEGEPEIEIEVDVVEAETPRPPRSRTEERRPRDGGDDPGTPQRPQPRSSPRPRRRPYTDDTGRYRAP